MTRPRISVTVGSTRYTFAVMPLDKEGNHVIQRTLRGFPDAAPPSGEVQESNYLPSKVFTLTPPLGVGLVYGHDPHLVRDATADTRWKSGIYPSRLQTNPTIPAECAAVQFKVFFHATGQLFMGGVGTSTVETADEALLYFDGTNMADTTAKDDIDALSAGGTMIVTSGCEHAGRAYIALRGTLQGSPAGAIAKIARSAVNTATAWANQATDLSTNPIAGSPYGLVSDGVTMYVAEWTAASNTITVKNSADAGATWPNTDATILSSRAPVDGNAAVLFSDGTTTPVDDYWLGTAEGLYKVAVSVNTFTRMVTFQHQESAYTGQVIATALGLIFTDGPVVYLGNWADGQFGYKAITDSLPSVPLSKSGDITAIAYDSTLNEVACYKGGQAASRQSTLYIYSFVTKLWSCMEQQPTANKVMFAAIYSSETGGTNKLHRVRDHPSTANHSSPSYLDYISEDPDIQTAATFTHSNSYNNIIRTSRFDGNAPSIKKGFYKQRIRADGLSGTEYLSVKFATDNGSLGSAQTLTAGPVGSLWTDGSTTAVGSDAYDIDAEITMVVDPSTSTTIPRIRTISWMYEPVPLKDDNTPIRTFTFRLSLDNADYEPGADIESAADARSKLETILANRPLVQLAFGQDFPNNVAISSALKVRMQPYESRRTIGSVQDQEDKPMDGIGYTDVTFSEVI